MKIDKSVAQNAIDIHTYIHTEADKPSRFDNIF